MGQFNFLVGSYSNTDSYDWIIATVPPSGGIGAGSEKPELGLRAAEQSSGRALMTMLSW